MQLEGEGRSWPRVLPSVLCCHSKLRPLCFVQSCGDLPFAHSAIKNFPRFLVCLVVFLGDEGNAQEAMGWCRAPVLQGWRWTLCPGFSIPGTQLKAIMCVLKTLPAFSSFPRDLPTLPDPWRLLPSTGAPTSPLIISSDTPAVNLGSTSFTDLKPLPSPAAGPRCFLLLQQLSSEAWGCLLSA